MNELKKTFLVGSLVCLNWAAASLGHAADITWTSPTDISGDSDVLTTGTLIQATSLGDSQDSGTTVNGVSFDAWDLNTNYSDGAFAFNNSEVLVSGPATEFIGGFMGYAPDSGSGTDPIDALSANYQTLLNFGDYGDGNSVMTLTLSGLTVGQTYQFQWWANDSRDAYYPQTVTATAGNAVTLNADTSVTGDTPANTAGGTGQFAIGTFVADGTTQDITFQGGESGGTLQNAFLLTEAPEPSTWALMFGSVLGLFFLARRVRTISNS